MHVIVDTNVLIVANREASQATFQCVINCVQKLQQIQRGQILVIDDNWQILNEYKNKVSPSGQPGVGDAFLRWVLTNLRNPDRCEQVTITQLFKSEFAEFPADPSLEKFDLSDRKFVAVALAHPAHPPITNAVDSDWYIFQSALEANGLQIDFLCP
ncbi:hypothetical protein H6F86_16660 [Phormidium sp. FACHB-592]|uniref:PIN domain-containing protein n=1 Tax=Stenomitos frigidus AS-A4 TaxID=2933935 RepID=A0ABV0KRT3_9CYAN|nr:hypothetical protein [Phormidium sp. FACHB-592]MBD2075497.1 hypothetical protein [Phormidium sp. FACHB-592]